MAEPSGRLELGSRPGTRHHPRAAGGFGATGTGPGILLTYAEMCPKFHGFMIHRFMMDLWWVYDGFMGFFWIFEGTSLVTVKSGEMTWVRVVFLGGLMGIALSDGGHSGSIPRVRWILQAPAIGCQLLSKYFLGWTSIYFGVRYPTKDYPI